MKATSKQHFQFRPRHRVPFDQALLRHVLFLIVFSGFSALSVAQGKPGSSPAPTLFVHVNVVPMDVDRVLPSQDVLVDGGVIRKIGEHIEAPPGALVVDGHGTAYLSPGLADMHVHTDTRREMAVFLAKGVTTVLNMGHPRASFLNTLRPAINRGEIPGPRIYAGFMIDGAARYNELFVNTPAEARAIADIAKTNGYDFIKVYTDLSPECFYALIDQGKVDGLPVIGHSVASVGLEKQFAAGQIMVAHTEEYFYAFFQYPQDAAPTAAPATDQIPAAIAFTKQDGAFVTADLITYATIARQWARPEVIPQLLQVPGIRYVDPDTRISWQHSDYTTRKGSIDGRVEFEKTFLREMDKAGVPLLAGTDTPSIPGLAPGFSLHEDLHALQQAGLPIFDVLSTATRVPGEFIRKAKPGDVPFGTVAAGMRADLILSTANPLQDLSTLEQPLGVMANGRWYKAEELQKMLADVAADYDAAQVKPAKP